MCPKFICPVQRLSSSPERPGESALGEGKERQVSEGDLSHLLQLQDPLLCPGRTKSRVLARSKTGPQDWDSFKACSSDVSHQGGAGRERKIKPTDPGHRQA
jgi:hypothetical protein